MAPIPVIAAIISNDTRLLLCQRKSGALAGKWEFPGGKLEEGETPEECLVREIQEELSINIRVNRIYKAVNMTYPHGEFLLIAFMAEFLDGEIDLRVHQDIAWVDPWRLLEYDLSEANIPIARQLVEESNSSRASMRSYSRPN